MAPTGGHVGTSQHKHLDFFGDHGRPSITQTHKQAGNHWLFCFEVALTFRFLKCKVKQMKTLLNFKVHPFQKQSGFYLLFLFEAIPLKKCKPVIQTIKKLFRSFSKSSLKKTKMYFKWRVTQHWKDTKIKLKKLNSAHNSFDTETHAHRETLHYIVVNTVHWIKKAKIGDACSGELYSRRAKQSTCRTICEMISITSHNNTTADHAATVDWFLFSLFFLLSLPLIWLIAFAMSC